MSSLGDYRSIFNGQKGASLSSRGGDQIRYKIWNESHLEFEFNLSKYDRYPVLHYLIRPNRKFVLGGSVEHLFDFVLDWNFIRFSNLDAGFPGTAKIFENTFSEKREDVFLSRAIEPYSGENHWFVCLQGANHGPDYVSYSDSDRALDKNDELGSMSEFLITLGDKLLDDLNPSTIGAIFRGINWANKKIVAPALLKGIFGEPPKWVEFFEKGVDLNEKIKVYSDRFCVDDLRDAFAK